MRATREERLAKQRCSDLLYRNKKIANGFSRRTFWVKSKDLTKVRDFIQQYNTSCDTECPETSMKNS